MISDARFTLNAIGDQLRAGAPLTVAIKARTFAAIRDLRATEGDDAARTVVAKLRVIMLARAADSLRPTTKSTRRRFGASPDAPRGVSAAELQAMAAEFERRVGPDYGRDAEYRHNDWRG